MSRRVAKVNLIDIVQMENGRYRARERYRVGTFVIDMSGFGATRREASARCHVDLLRAIEESGVDPEYVETARMLLSPSIDEQVARERVEV